MNLSPIALGALTVDLSTRQLYSGQMNENSRKDIRKLLKTFGIQADEAITAHLANHAGDQPLRIRLVLQDVTNYSDSPPDAPLQVEVEGEIRL